MTLRRGRHSFPAAPVAHRPRARVPILRKLRISQRLSHLAAKTGEKVGIGMGRANANLFQARVDCRG